MPDLESEESAEQKRNQKGVWLKKLTPDQMLNRLAITLAQLKAGNNSEKRIRWNKTIIVLFLSFKKKKKKKPKQSVTI